MQLPSQISLMHRRAKTFRLTSNTERMGSWQPTVAGLDIAFALREETTLETAHDLARRMRQMVVSVLVTVGPQPNVLNIR
jgi:hypothetical protein